MGFNTVVVVMNDAIHAIEEDTSWGERLGSTIRRFWHGSRSNSSPFVSAHTARGGIFVNAAEVISQAHADGYQFVVAHGNTGWEITSDPSDGVPDEIIRIITERLKMRRAAAKKSKEVAA